MTTAVIRYAPPALSLPRIGGWSASLTIHLVALGLLLSAPAAYQLVSRAPPDQTVVMRFIEEKPVPEVKEPEPPQPLVHHVRTPVSRAPVVETHVPVTTEQTPVSTAAESDAPPSLDTGTIVAPPAPADTEPSAIAYNSRTSVPYPRESLKAREQGTVILLVLVGVEGNVEDIRIEKSSGFTRLDRAARDAVKSWRFNPARHGGAAERAWAKVPISFNVSTL